MDMTTIITNTIMNITHMIIIVDTINMMKIIMDHHHLIKIKIIIMIIQDQGIEIMKKII